MLPFYSKTLDFLIVQVDELDQFSALGFVSDLQVRCRMCERTNQSSYCLVYAPSAPQREYRMRGSRCKLNFGLTVGWATSQSMLFGK